ncbi:Rha family transcriptional regulator [Paenibacillus sp. FSL R10-2782]|uniref:Rha family transcriptional regulator n=1 Tax=Paenibacillus sp. FSL R10-2782 TaxID=2954661 RepID=UPI003158E4D9
MSKLVLNPDCGLYERKGRAYCSSRQMAEEFERRHDHVLRMIDDLTAPTSGVSAEFITLNFEASKYKDASGKQNREILMTKDGFVLVSMEIKGAKARKFKEAYIRRFNQMESFIKSLQAAKLEHPAFTDAIMNAHEEPKHYHFSNEADMINRVVLGMSAKQFREANGITKGESIRRYLTTEQIQAVETLQRVDIGLIVAIPDFQQRKEILTGYYEKIKLKKIA